MATARLSWWALSLVALICAGYLLPVVQVRAQTPDALVSDVVDAAPAASVEELVGEPDTEGSESEDDGADTEVTFRTRARTLATTLFRDHRFQGVMIAFLVLGLLSLLTRESTSTPEVSMHTALWLEAQYGMQDYDGIAMRGGGGRVTRDRPEQQGQIDASIGPPGKDDKLSLPANFKFDRSPHFLTLFQALNQLDENLYWRTVKSREPPIRLDWYWSTLEGKRKTAEQGFNAVLRIDRGRVRDAVELENLLWRLSLVYPPEFYRAKALSYRISYRPGGKSESDQEGSDQR